MKKTIIIWILTICIVSTMVYANNLNLTNITGVWFIDETNQATTNFSNNITGGQNLTLYQGDGTNANKVGLINQGVLIDDDGDGGSPSNDDYLGYSDAYFTNSANKFTIMLAFNGSADTYNTEFIIRVGAPTSAGKILVDGGNWFSAGVKKFQLQSQDIGSSYDQNVSSLGYNYSKWYCVALTNDGSVYRLYVDGVFTASLPIVTLGAETISIMIGDKAYGQGFAGIYDNINIWKRALSASEAMNASTQNNCTPYTASAAAPEILNMTLILKNYADVTYSSISNQNDFTIHLNFTNQSGAKPDTNCTFTAYNNISYTSELRTSTDYNLTSSSMNLTLIVSENTTGLWRDEMKFDVCQVGSGSNLDMYINGSLYRTIPSAVIPACTGKTSFHAEDNITSQFINNRSLNFTVKCSGLCGIANRAITVLYDADGGTLHYNRQFNASHIESLVYNATSLLYSMPDKYKYMNTPLNITGSCNTTSVNFVQNVSLNNLTFRIFSVNDIPFINGMSIPSNFSYNFTTDISGGIISLEQINLSYGNGTLIKTYNNIENISYNASLLPKDGVYNFSVYAISDSGVIYSNSTIYFLINDSIIPIITIIFPLNTSHVYKDETFTTDIICSDVNLYAYEIDIYYPNGTLFQTNNMTGLIPTYEIRVDAMPNVLGEWKLAAYCSDSHTATSLKTVASKIDDAQKSVILYHKEKHAGKWIYGNMTILDNSGDYVSMKMVTEKDRYSFDYMYAKPMKSLSYEIIAPGFEHLPDSIYPGHFVSLEAYQWLDFNSSNLESIKITEKGIGDYLIDITLINPSNNVMFHSIGGLNIVNENVTFNVTLNPAYSSILRSGVCPETTQGQFELFAGYILLFIVILIGLKFKAAIISVFASLGMMGLALVTMGCSAMLGFTMIIIAVLMFFISLSRKLF